MDKNLSPAACVLNGQHTFLGSSCFCSQRRTGRHNVWRRCFYLLQILPWCVEAMLVWIECCLCWSQSQLVLNRLNVICCSAPFIWSVLSIKLRLQPVTLIPTIVILFSGTRHVLSAKMTFMPMDWIRKCVFSPNTSSMLQTNLILDITLVHTSCPVLIGDAQDASIPDTFPWKKLKLCSTLKSSCDITACWFWSKPRFEFLIPVCSCTESIWTYFQAHLIQNPRLLIISWKLDLSSACHLNRTTRASARQFNWPGLLISNPLIQFFGCACRVD